MEGLITKIRPAARIISTIGEDLVGDPYAAIVELVKNSYDADASFADIVFEFKIEKNKPWLQIEIKDDGHGMTTETVLNKWLVPATKDKLERKTSKKGRTLQGRKGIGRYAAAILGQELVMKTVSSDKIQTEIFVDWSSFEKKEYLEEVEVLVTSTQVNNPPGTTLTISATDDKVHQWGKDEIAKLTKELRKLKSPFQNVEEFDFKIRLAFFNSPFEGYDAEVFEIDAFPIIDLYDYRIFGSMNETGKVVACYENKSELNLPSEQIEFDMPLTESSTPGPVEFDFRVFDREKEAIVNLINKGLIDPISRLAVGKMDAKRLLDEVYGVNLYREGFRVRPYGNGGIDWLNLDKDRIQNPSFRIGNNQIVGFVNVKPEEVSKLEEKSARDGLKENSHYQGLVSSLRSILAKLEERRFIYRKKVGKGRRSGTVESELNALFNYEHLAGEIEKRLSFVKADRRVINEIVQIIHKDAEYKSKLLENIQTTIAIYQGQATLGKIVTVLLHEGRKPVSYFRQQSENLLRWLKYYKAKRDWEDETYDEMIERLKNFKGHSILLASLFKRLDPLAKQNKGDKTEFILRDAIEKAKAIFDSTITEKNIQFELICDEKIALLGWEEDIIIAVANLIENSIYWLDFAVGDRKISIEVVKEESLLLHYKDTGPGIDRDSIESAAIFEPGFSKKLDGTGLGLPIAGEAVERLGGSITAHYSETGAYFTIEFK